MRRDDQQLAPRLEAVRRSVVLARAVGLEATRAVVDAGFGELSTNVAIIALSHLDRDGPLRPRDLLPPVSLTRGGLTNLLDRLEAEGWISRVYGNIPEDRRGAEVSITPSGRAAIDTVTGIVADSMARRRDVLDEIRELLVGVHGEPEASDVAAMSSVELLARMGEVLVGALAGVDPDDPTPAMTMVVLCAAAERDGTRPKVLVERTGLSNAGVTHLLDRLEDADLVERSTGHAPDRRVTTITLTSDGHERLVRGLSASADALEALGRVDRADVAVHAEQHDLSPNGPT